MYSSMIQQKSRFCGSLGPTTQKSLNPQARLRCQIMSTEAQSNKADLVALRIQKYQKVQATHERLRWIMHSRALHSGHSQQQYVLYHSTYCVTKNLPAKQSALCHAAMVVAKTNCHTCHVRTPGQRIQGTCTLPRSINSPIYHTSATHHTPATSKQMQCAHMHNHAPSNKPKHKQHHTVYDQNRHRHGHGTPRNRIPG